MAAQGDESLRSRPPKIKPQIAILIGIALIPVGFSIKGAIGGGLIGGGFGAILTGIWDLARRRFVARRRARAEKFSSNDRMTQAGTGVDRT
jgi:hypothetical protein